jgi:F-type H+-transporting ATPase subunit a
MDISPDATIFWQWGVIKLNATIATTWLNMLLLSGGAALITARLTAGAKLSRWQNLLEALVDGIVQELAAIGLEPPRDFLPFLGTLFIFILFSNLLAVVPGYQPPTGSLSTATALAGCVFIAIPWWGIKRQGLAGYLKLYIQPSVIMLPFNIIGELSRTLALAVRLFGNIMSGSMIGAILLIVAPLVFPVIMNLLGLIIGVIQAYIFVVLAAVYIAAAIRVEKKQAEKPQEMKGVSHG